MANRNTKKMKQQLDQFYTKENIAKMCWEHLLHEMNININDDITFLEPSAGKGVFLNLMPERKRFGFDIEPKHDDIEKRNFFDIVAIDDPNTNVVVGNPPFGKRAKLAVSFFNHAASIASTVAFIVPIIFQKFAIHKKLDSRMKFVSRLPLPKDAFELDNGKSYAVNTEFQVWTRMYCEHEDMREYTPPPIVHKDFQMWQYNNTPAALNAFENDFDFAIPCQGWQDYTRKETSSESCEKHKQWILLKTNDSVVLSQLMLINYDDLAQRCGTAVPGFRKSDLVNEYKSKYE